MNDAYGPPVKDLAYFFSQTNENKDSCFRAISRIPSRLIGISDLEKELYSGDSWILELGLRGISRRKIIKIKPALDLLPPCTDSEARGLVRTAMKMDFQDVAIVSPPFHILRAAISTISAVLKNEASKLNVWCVAGAPQKWLETGIHTQSTGPISRLLQLQSEVAKIETYFAKSDLVSAEEILNYFQERDGRSS